jgi:acetolactate synthase-1/2/3 large subunit
MTYAIPALAEALHDAVPLVYVLEQSAVLDGPDFQLQALNESELLAPVVKGVVRIESASEVIEKVDHAFAMACEDTPGPVAILLARGLGEQKAISSRLPSPRALQDSDEELAKLESLASRLASGKRTVIFVDQTVDSVAGELKSLVNRSNALVMSTPGARGVFDELDPRYVMTDRRPVASINELIGNADVLLSIGVKFSHSNTHGFGLEVSDTEHVWIGRSQPPEYSRWRAEVIEASPRKAVSFLNECLADATGAKGEEISGPDIPDVERPEPTIAGAVSSSMFDFFRQLREHLSPDAVLVTDSGNHQFLVRQHFRVRRPAGLVTPAEFQSMGFAAPAAIGVRIAEASGDVAVIVGDGGVQMTGMDIATMVRLGLNIPIFVFCDGRFGLIHSQQIQRFGRAAGTEIPTMNLQALANGLGASFTTYAGNVKEILDDAKRRSGPTIVEVILQDSSQMKMADRKAKVKKSLRRLLRG